jgi:RimJ/RimL family protein N-acetyltransferase
MLIFFVIIGKTKEENRVSCVDKTGDTVVLAEVTDEDIAAILAMYDEFEPKAVTQGLPPAPEKVRHLWVRELLGSGLNFIACRQGKVIGHASVILDRERNDGEYLIFVDHRVRNRGVGTVLTELAVRKGAELGLKAIWLTVEALNFRAINLYKNIGFRFLDSGERERTMLLDL